MQMQVNDDNRQPGGGRNSAKEQPGSLDCTQCVVVRRRRRDTISCTLDTSSVTKGGRNSGSENSGCNRGKENQVGRVLQLIGEDNIRDGKDEGKDCRDGFEDIGDKETRLEEIGLVVVVGLWAGETASAGAVGVIGILLSICSLEDCVYDERGDALCQWHHACRVHTLGYFVRRAQMNEAMNKSCSLF